MGSYSREKTQSSKEQNTYSFMFFSLNRRKKLNGPSIQLKRQKSKKKWIYEKLEEEFEDNIRRRWIKNNKIYRSEKFKSWIFEKTVISIIIVTIY